MNVAPSAGTVDVQAGTYTGQVEITKPLTLAGAGATTVIQAPTTLSVSFTALGYTNKPIIYVYGTPGVTIEDLKVDGLGLGNANSRFMGIAYYEAGGEIDAAVVTDVEDTPFSVAQDGYGIYADADNGTAQNLEIAASNVSNFEKNGITVNGANLTVNIHDNTVTGAGATSAIAQNGIQIGGGAQGIIGSSNPADGNSVSNIDYTGGGTWATSILSVGSGASLTIDDNQVTGAQMAIYVDTPATISGNAITGTGSNAFGIDASSATDTNNAEIEQNTLSNVGVGILVDNLGSTVQCRGFGEHDHGEQHQRRHGGLRTSHDQRQYSYRRDKLRQRHHRWGRGRADGNRHQQPPFWFRTGKLGSVGRQHAGHGHGGPRRQRLCRHVEQVHRPGLLRLLGRQYRCHRRDFWRHLQRRHRRLYRRHSWPAPAPFPSSTPLPTRSLMAWTPAAWALSEPKRTTSMSRPIPTRATLALTAPASSVPSTLPRRATPSTSRPAATSEI